MTAVTPTANQTASNPLQNYLNQQAQEIAANKANSSSSSGNGASTLEGITGSFNTFLSILTTQLQNQDPSNPANTDQFTQELVEFAGVEQQLNTNSDLQTLINLQKSNGGLSTTLGYIGGYVEVPSANQVPLQNGNAEIAYTLPAGTSNATITIQNSSGQTVATLNGSTNTGTNYVTWNGQDSNGNQLADGTYSFQISAATSAGSAVTPANVNVFGLVTSVRSNSDGTSSVLFGNGGMTANTSTIGAVYSASSLPPATTASTTSNQNQNQTSS